MVLSLRRLSIANLLHFCLFLFTCLNVTAFLPHSSTTSHCFIDKKYNHQRINYNPKRTMNIQSFQFPSCSASSLYASVIPSSFSLFATPSMYLVRIVFLRSLALVYAVAFLVARNQNKALIGDNGITPARNVLRQAYERGRATRQRREEWLEIQKQARQQRRMRRKKRKTRFLRLLCSNPIRAIGDSLNQMEFYKTIREKCWDRSDRMGRPVTTLLWFAPDKYELNPWLDGIANAGLALAAAVFVLGSANVPLLLGLWACQRSLMAVGGPWYGYGWEPQLAELGFHALFLVPPLSLNPFHGNVSTVATWAMRWFLFRIMMGAGLIKLKPRSDKKWKDLTAMNYFYETQPVPNPFTRYFHWMPQFWHKFEVLTNHFVEVVAPFLLILPGLPTSLRRAGGLIQLIFQSVLISSGNLSFLNWLTMVPALFALDDGFLGKYFSESSRTAAAAAASAKTSYRLGWVRNAVDISFGVLIASLSVAIVKNLLAKQQVMNGSFDPLRLVNTYGAFGSVNEDRYELVVSSANSVVGPWQEYEFKVKPGSLDRSPKWISPYHYRLDWQLWIASTVGSIEASPWMYSFLQEILLGNKEVLDLLENDPWSNEERYNSQTGEIMKPKYIRVDRYRYNFHRKQKGKFRFKHPYWDREYAGRFFPRQGVATLEDLKEFTKSNR